MDPIRLDYAEQYLLDRIEELTHQLPHGNPFVFLGALTVLRTLGTALGLDASEVMSRYAGYEGDVLTCLRNSFVFHDPLSTLSMNCPGDRFKLNLTHENDKHGRVEEAPGTGAVSASGISSTNRGNVKATISAELFLGDVKVAVKNIFKEAKEDEVRSAELFVAFNKNRFIGLVP